MQPKTLVYDIESVNDEGIVKIHHVEISMVSHALRIAISGIIKESLDIQEKSNRLMELTNESILLEMEKPDGWEEKHEAIKREIRIINDSVIEFSKDFFDRRFEILKKLLIKNKITHGDLLLKDFWENDVNPNEMIRILIDCATKDIEPDKKKLNPN